MKIYHLDTQDVHRIMSVLNKSQKEKTMNSLVWASLRSDKRVHPSVNSYRYLTLDECKALHGRVNVLDRHGKIAEVAITSVKTWKTRPDVRIGWKFGLYEYGQELITSDDDNRFFVVPAED